MVPSNAGAKHSTTGSGWVADHNYQAASESASRPQEISGPDGTRGVDKSASIGLLLEQHNASRRVYIKSLMPGGPAFLDARLKQGDRLLSVDGVAVHGMDLSHVFEMIKGAAGTEACIHSASALLRVHQPLFPRALVCQRQAEVA